MRAFHASKKILALILAVAIITVMLPFTALAASDMMSVVGTVTDFDFVGNFVVQTRGGGSNVFHYDGSDPLFLSKGDTVRVYFIPEDPGIAIEVDILNIANAPAPVKHTHYSVTGVITDAGMSTITILSNGKYFTFGKDDVKLVNVTDGLLLGDTVEVTVADEDRSTALQIKMIAMGGNHQNQTTQDVSHYSVTGQIVDMTMNTITIISKGKYCTFTTEDARKTGSNDGFLLGDTVKITVTSADKKAAKEIRMVRYGDNH